MWFRLALAASLLTPVIHIAVLLRSGQDVAATAIAELSQSPWGALHSAELVLFSCAHLALAVGLGQRDKGRLWPFGRLLLAASGLMLLYVAYYFATASLAELRGPEANDPLWIVATLTGLAMGALGPGLARLSRQLGLMSGICLGLWLWLVPLILLVDNSWIGAYERLVGTVYVAWTTGLSLGLLRLGHNPHAGSEPPKTLS